MTQVTHRAQSLGRFLHGFGFVKEHYIGKRVYFKQGVSEILLVF